MRYRFLLLVSVAAVVFGLTAGTGSALAAYGDYVSSITAGSMNQPTKVALDTNGDLYVTDAGSKTVKRYNSAGSYVSSFSVSGKPVGIAVTTNNIFVGDDTNDCVWIFDKSGVLTNLAATSTTNKLGGLTAPSIKMPNTVAIGGSGHIFVCDGDNDKVYIFNADGSSFSSFGIAGTATSSGQTINLYYPSGLTFVPNPPYASGAYTQTFFLGDQGNYRVQKLTYSYGANGVITTAPTWAANIGTGSRNDAFGAFVTVSDLAYDKYNNYLLVVDTLQSVVQEFNASTGATVSAAFNYSGGAVQTNLNVPTGAVADNSAKALYVANNQGASIAKFTMAAACSPSCPTLTVDSPASAVTRSLSTDSPYTVNYHYSSPAGTGTLYVFADTDTSWSSGAWSTAENRPNEVKLGSASVAQAASSTAGTIPANVIILNPGTYNVRGLLVDSAGNYVEAWSAGTLVVTGTSGGLNDMFKALYGVTDPNADPDNDGLTNLQEQQYGTNPNVADTDGGGVIDGVEVAKGTDPTVSSDDFNSLPDQFGWFYNKISNQWNTRYTVTNYSASTAWIDVTTYAYLTANKEGHYYTSIPANGTAEIDMTNTAFGMTIEDRGSVDIRSTTPQLSGIQHFIKLDVNDPQSWDWLHLCELAPISAFRNNLNQAFYNVRQDVGNHFITYIMCKNPSNAAISVNANFYTTTTTGTPAATGSVTIQPHQSLAINPALFASVPTTGNYTLNCTTPIMGYENYFKQNEANLAVNDFSNSLLQENGDNVSTTLYVPWYVKNNEVAGGYRPYIFFKNSNAVTANITMTGYNADGTAGGSFPITLPAYQSVVTDPTWYGTITALSGSLVITSDQPISGFHSLQYFNATDGTALDMTATANLVKTGGKTLIASDFNLTTGYYSWVNICNLSSSAVSATAYYYNQAGTLIYTQPIALNGHGNATVDLSTLGLSATRGSIKIYEPTGSIYAILNECRYNPAGSTVKPGARDAGEAAQFTVLQ